MEVLLGCVAPLGVASCCVAPAPAPPGPRVRGRRWPPLSL